MEFIKNFLALALSTAVWTAGFVAILSVYFIIIEQDAFYLAVLVFCILVMAVGIFLGKHNTRVQAALEIPMGIFGL